VIQENRTPDNLFHNDQTLVDNGGNVRPPGDQGKCGDTPITLTAARIDTCYDTRHGHIDWVNSFNSGQMNGACNVGIAKNTGCIVPTCNGPVQQCPAYAYVPNSAPDNLLTPYFQIANEYGFANYMFQTNQGPSFPAHQFLFGATSLPTPYPDPKFTWFAADNVYRDKNDPNQNVGCIGPDSERVPLIDDLGNWPHDGCTPGSQDSHCIKPCLDHRTLLNVIDTIIPRVTWRYYAHSPADLWEAPAAVQNVCQPRGGVCDNDEYKTHVIFPTSDDKSPVLTDIENCNPTFKFPSVAWVVPDGKWSDHAGSDNAQPSGHDGGPSFVAHIVNAVGNSTCAGDNHPNWSNTIILVTWDDWGGFYDHVSPSSPDGPGIGYNQGNAGSDKYVYSFRVPLLVVSGYVKQVTPQGGYVSGPKDGHVCDGTTNYCHDFGSILNFVEYVFGIGGAPLGTIGDGHSNYADHWAPDAVPTCVSQSVCPYSLSDFFNFNQNLRTFTTITGWKYPELCFHKPNTTQCWGLTSSDADPDNDALEE